MESYREMRKKVGLPNGVKTMTKEEILKAVRDLSFSQGFYGRVYEQIKDNDELLTYLEEQHFSDSVDMILFFEC